MVDIPEHLDR